MSDRKNKNLPSDYDEQFIRDIMEETRRANETVIYQQAMMQQQQMQQFMDNQINQNNNPFPPGSPIGPF